MSVVISPELRASLAAPEAVIPAVAEKLGNPAWDDAAQRVLIARLSPFDDVVGSSSHLFLFAETRRALGRAFIDFAFFPDRGDREVLSARGLPFFYGLASGRPPEDFDLILVSNAFALELVNIGYLFRPPRFPSRASERARAGEGCPIAILGGSNAAAAGALLLPGAAEEARSDCLVDGIFFGEGEGALAELVTALAGDARKPRSDRLDRASRVWGFWPALSGSSAKRSVARPYPAPLVDYPVLNSREAGVARLQISAGCPGLCSFCLAGWDRRPYREIPADRIVAAARELRARSGAETLEVYSFNFNTHSAILELIFELGRIFKRVNLMSQRLDVLARHPALLAAELAADKRSFTLGVEGVSGRMRAYYRKGLCDEDIDSAADSLIASGVRELKLFYIIAGIEGQDDLSELASFMARLSALKRERAVGVRLLASAGYLVRLPSTPLQHAPLCLDRERLEKIAEGMRAICDTEGVEFRLAADYDEYMADQLLSLAGRSLGSWIERASTEGRIYDGGLSRGAARSLESFARGAGLLESAFLGEKAEDWEPPLSFAADGSNALRAGYRLAVEGRDRRPCLGIEEGSPGSCEGCGACEDPADAARLTGHAVLGLRESSEKTATRIARLVGAKRRLARVAAIVELPESLGRATPEYRAAWLSRRIASLAPEESRALLEVSDALFEEMIERYWGKALYALSGPDERLLAVAAAKAGLEISAEAPMPSTVEIEARFPVAYAEGARAALDAWLKAERVDVVETRAEAGRKLECSSKAEKKRILYRAELYEIAGAGAAVSGTGAAYFAARLSLGPKARLADWLHRLPPRVERSSSVRVVSW